MKLSKRNVQHQTHKCTFTLGIVFCFDHEAEIPSASILDRCVPSPRQDSLKVLLRESIIDFLLQTIVTTSIVGTANPDLQQVRMATITYMQIIRHATYELVADNKSNSSLAYNIHLYRYT